MFKRAILIMFLLLVSLSVNVLANNNETIETVMNITGNIPTSTIFFAVAGEPHTGEISLEPNQTTLLSCWGEAFDLDGLDDLADLSSVIFADSSSRFAPDNESVHYTNNSCDTSTWNDDGLWNCTYVVQYYAEPSEWTCAINITNTDPQYYNDTINTTAEVNELVALEVHNKTVDFGLRAVGVNYTADTEVVVYNTGNVVLDLQLDAANMTEDPFDLDSPHAFNCSIGVIPVTYLRFSTDFDTPYLSSVPMVESGATAAQTFGLAPQVGGNVVSDAPTFDSTFWAPAIPMNIAGTCTGRIMYIGTIQE